VSLWGTDFIGCTFYDLTIYYPLTNFVQIGGDVLVRPFYLSRQIRTEV
jgi:hypothetical protein